MFAPTRQILRLLLLVLAAVTLSHSEGVAAASCPWKQSLAPGFHVACPPETNVHSAGWFYTKVVTNVFWPAQLRDECAYAFENPVAKGTKSYPASTSKTTSATKTTLTVPQGVLKNVDLKEDLGSQNIMSVTLDSFTSQVEMLGPRADWKLLKNCDDFLFDAKGNKNPKLGLGGLIPLRLITDAEFIDSFSYTLQFNRKFDGNVDAVIKTVGNSNPELKVEGSVTSEGNVKLTIKPGDGRFLLGFRDRPIVSRSSLLGR